TWQRLSVMGENVLFGPARNIEQRARRKEVETGAGKGRALLALEPLVELFLERMEITDIARRIFALSVRELVGAPVAGLLLLRNLVPQKLLDQVLEPMAIGIGTDQPRSGACAIKR